MIESKVSVPAIGTSAVLVLTAALFHVAEAFGLQVSPEQRAALAGLGAAATPFIGLALGYLAPHTPRPDLGQHDPPA